MVDGAQSTNHLTNKLTPLHEMRGGGGRLELTQDHVAERWYCWVWCFSQPGCVNSRWWQVWDGRCRGRGTGCQSLLASNICHFFWAGTDVLGGKWRVACSEDFRTLQRIVFYSPLPTIHTTRLWKKHYLITYVGVGWPCCLGILWEPIRETRSHVRCQGTLGHSHLSSLRHCELILA